MCMTDYDRPSVYSERERIARKDHKCGECGRTILKGEPYQFVSGVWDGRANSYKTCSHCCVVQEWLMRECSGFMFSMIGEDIEDHARDYSRIDLFRLRVGMRHQWRTRKGRPMQIPAVPRGLGKADSDRLIA